MSERPICGDPEHRHFGPCSVYDHSEARALRDAESAWIRSSFCNASSCVEIMYVGSQVWTRGWRYRGDSIAIIDRDEWESFVAGVKAGEFDQPGRET